MVVSHTACAFQIYTKLNWIQLKHALTGTLREWADGCLAENGRFLIAVCL